MKDKISNIWADEKSVYNTKKFRDKKANAVKEAYKDTDLLLNLSERKKEEWSNINSGHRSIERKNKASESMKYIWKNKSIDERIEWCNNLSKGWSDESKANQSERMKNNFKDLKFTDKLKTSLTNLPNKKELILINILKELSTNFEYVGDFKIWVDGKNPDFIDEDKNKIIELFGDYWHSEELTGKPEYIHEQERIDHFNNSGYDTLIIWENELKNIHQLKVKIINFYEVLS